MRGAGPEWAGKCEQFPAHRIRSRSGPRQAGRPAGAARKSSREGGIKVTRIGEKAGYAAMLLGAAVLIYVSRSYAPQDGVYPHIVLLILGILAAVGLYQSFQASRAELEPDRAEAKAGEPEPEAGGLWHVAIYIALTLLFILSWNWIGTLPAAFLFSLVLLLLNGERRIWMLVALPVLLTALLYAVFQVILYLPLPRGIF